MTDLRYWISALYEESGLVRLLSVMAAVAINLAIFSAWAPNVAPEGDVAQAAFAILLIFQCLIVAAAFTWIVCARKA